MARKMALKIRPQLTNRIAQGAGRRRLNICLMFDLPLFIDPFLLYASEKPELRALHEQVIEYLWFLRCFAPRVHNDWDLKEYFCFSEVRQTWLGFTDRGN
jgi:hypothetical protein